MDMTNDEYKKFADRHAPRSSFWPDVGRAFLCGGLICCLGQFLDGLYLSAGMNTDAASELVSISLIFLSALLTGLGVYVDIARFAGAGTLVPITGFANSVVSPALEFRTEGFVLGTAAKMFIIAGPVIVFGIGSSVVYGLILVLVGAA